jgi:hypothetical protein
MTAPSFPTAFGIVKAIDADHKAQCRRVHEAYEEEMQPLRAEFRRREHDASRRMKAALAELNKWRNTAIRVAGAMPVKVAHVQDLQRQAKDSQL